LGTSTINQFMAALAASFVERLLDGSCYWMASWMTWMASWMTSPTGLCSASRPRPAQFLRAPGFRWLPFSLASTAWRDDDLARE
jgi:hypothetical protein